ncbi:EAL and HDOD domain-containing protein [Pseudoalteromonas sp. S3431]|uniref:EAL and HDOD domain-containing protein n=1 Tax=Pseudoalteromonas sp. S3431 TaxID=579537 RepID=UPI0004A0D0E7|nr:EAL domain-containing protein [Pseudoalteromonas sp. S3431]KDC55471.1 diguanylate phosphodiesterase [Pseudoalteromonas sp. S3431]
MKVSNTPTLTPTLTQYVARQPIFNAEKEVFAYELLYRNSSNNAFPVGTSDEHATSRLFFNTLMLVGAEKLTAHQLAFINLSTDALLDDFPKLLNPEMTVIEIVERTVNIDEVAKRVTSLKKEGYTFALDDYDGDAKWEPLLALVSYIKIEADEPIIKTNMHVKKLKRKYPHCKIIVERIETHEQFKVLKTAGCDLFQGFFFARPEMLTYSGIDPSKVTVFDLLKSTSKESLCFEEIHQRVARDVGITTRILKLANARSGNSNLVITSISQAVVYLGEDVIRQFVRVLALSDLGIDKPTELTKFALVRARLIELILTEESRDLAQQGYLVGLFSMLDAILDIELNSIVKEFTLNKDITDALLYGSGVLGDCLILAKAIENKNWSLVDTTLKEINPQLPIEKLYNFVLESMLYSDDVIEVVVD